MASNRMRPACALLVLLAMACVDSLHAQEIPPLPTPMPPSPVQPVTLGELEAFALEHNPSLMEASAKIQAAQGEQVQAGLYPNPTVGYQGAEMGNEGRAGQQGAFVRQEIVTGSKRPLAQAAAAREVDVTRWAYEIQRQRVLADVRHSYFELLVAQRTLEVTQRLVEVGEKGLQTAQARLKAIQTTRFDLYQAQVEAESARLAAEKARVRRLAAWRELAAVLGSDDCPPPVLSGNLEDDVAELDWEAALQQVLSASPELAHARAEVARAQTVLARECAQRKPNVELEAGVAYDTATESTIAEVQVGVPLRLFDRNQGNILRAQGELSAAAAKVQRLENELRRRLAGAYERYSLAAFQAKKYSLDILPAAKASLDLADKGYRLGQLDYLTLLTAQRTYFQTNLEYIEALRTLHAAKTKIEANLIEEQP